jgi:Fe-S oxidoreductase
MDPRGQTQGQFRLEQGPENQIHGQDPCQIVRKSFGDPVAEDLRFVVKSVVGEENFIDMHPNRSNNFCCGGGGGFLQSGFKEERLKYGELKDGQIQATGADYCIAACHNCHAQIHELSEHYGAGYGVVHLWTLICLSLGVLGPNEREYLGMTSRKSTCFIRKRPVFPAGCRLWTGRRPGT